MKFYLLDVFCKQKFTGNQLAVVFADGNLSSMKMQSIANEFHFSETTFVIQDQSRDRSHRVRIFTPRAEVPFAGHPTLGTAWVIRERLLDRNTKEVVLDLNVGKIPVTFEDEKEILWMSQIEPSFGTIHDREDIAGVIGLQVADMDDRFPIRGVSTGIEFLMIPLKNLSAVRKAATDLSRYNRYFADTDPMPLFLFCPETYEQAHAVNCRMFADALGVTEDPATGSVNGCLAAYLVNHRKHPVKPVFRS